ncbi:MAG: hypothetical protein WC570_02445 [Patescibacteria group bacterium]
MKKYLYLEPDEDIDSVQKKIGQSKEKKINLVIPAQAKVLNNKNLQAIKAKITKSKKELLIHTNDPAATALAKANDLPIAATFSPVVKKISNKIDNNSKPIKIVYKKTPPQSHVTQPVVKKTSLTAKKPALDSIKEPSTLTQIIFGALSIISIIVIFLVILYVVPQTDIIITTQANKIPLDTNVTFDVNQSNVDYINNTLPAQIINIEEEIVHEERATGEINQGERAHGTITVHNQSSSALPLVGNTRFVTGDGKIFRSTGSVNVPAGGSANVAVIADDIGEDGNVGPTRFTLPALPGTESIIYGESNSAMTGGTNNITYVISEADLQFSTTEVKDKLYDQAIKDIEDKLPQDKKYISPDINTINIITEYSQKVGDQVETFNITAKATYPFLVYDATNLQELINQNLSKLVSQDRSVVSSTTPEYTIRIISADLGSGHATSNITTQAITTPTYNTDLMKKDLTGKSKEEVKEYFLQYPEIQQIDISFWPDWVKRVSKIPSRIDIEIVWK